MKILLTPCENDNDKIIYAYNGEVITATYKGATDTFDFSNLPDGVLQLYDQDGNFTVETTLEIMPIMWGTKRENGVLSVVLLNFIPQDATENEKYPNWIEV